MEWPRLSRNDPTIEWLLEAADPAVRHLALTDLLDRPAGDPEVRKARGEVATDRRVMDLLGEEHPDARASPAATRSSAASTDGWCRWSS